MAVAVHSSPADFPVRRRSHHPSRGRRSLLIVAAVVVVLLLLVRFLVSPLITSIANDRLAALPEYSGHVHAVHLALWRGQLEMRDFSLFRRGHEREGAVVHVQNADLSMRWSDLFRGRLGGEAKVDGATFMLLKDQPSPKEGKTKEEKERQKQERLAEVRRWQSVLREGFPIEFSRFELVNAEVKYKDITEQPPPELGIRQLHVLVTDLTRQADAGNPLPTRVQVTGVITGNGRLDASASLDALAQQPKFDARLEVKDLNVPDLAAFMRAYAQAEVHKGTFEVFLEAHASNGHYQGYVKPFFRDLEFKAVRDEDESKLKFLAVQAASAVQNALKNDEQKVATKAPFEGDFTNNDVDVFTTIENLLRNAFVQSLREGLEGQAQTR